MRSIRALVLGLAVLGTSVHAAQFTLTWTDNSSNESGFRIERATGLSATTGFAEIATVGANVVSFVDAGLPSSASYSYRLRAYNAAGNSGYSNVASGTTPAPPPPANNAPAISNVSNRSIYVGGTTGAVPFTVGDVETAASGLTVSTSSNNTTLLPAGAIVLGGSGSSRTIAVTPAAGRTGSATITVTVSDGNLSTSDSFVITVYAAGTGPTISTQPQATAITPGGAWTISVSAQSSGALSYQWYFNDTAIVGATSASYVVPVAQRSHAGAYHVVVTSGGISISSNTVIISAGSVVSTGRLVNLSTRGPVLTGDGVMISGFVVSGSGDKRMLLRLVGPGLTNLGVPGVLSDPQMVLKRWNGSAYVDIATNLDWSDGGAASSLRQAYDELGAFPIVDDSNDSALLLNLSPGVYTAFGSGEQSGATGNAIFEVYDGDVLAGGARMTNISTRGHIGVGDNVMITGFVVEDGPVTLLVRTLGPAIVPLGVPGAVSDPRMDLSGTTLTGEAVTGANDDWGQQSDAALIAQVTEDVGGSALEPGSKDAVLLVTLPAGSYTVLSLGAGGTTGIALVELYAVP